MSNMCRSSQNDGLSLRTLMIITGRIRDITEDMTTPKKGGCINFKDPEEGFFNQRNERIPLHHKNSWYLDRLVIFEQEGVNKNPLRLPEMRVCYRLENESRCQIHSLDDKDAACWINHQVGGLMRAPDLVETHADLAFYKHRRIQEGKARMKERRAQSRGAQMYKPGAQAALQEYDGDEDSL